MNDLSCRFLTVNTFWGAGGGGRGDRGVDWHALVISNAQHFSMLPLVLTKSDN